MLPVALDDEGNAMRIRSERVKGLASFRMAADNGGDLQVAQCRAAGRSTTWYVPASSLMPAPCFLSGPQINGKENEQLLVSQ